MGPRTVSATLRSFEAVASTVGSRGSHSFSSAAWEPRYASRHRVLSRVNDRLLT